MKPTIDQLRQLLDFLQSHYNIDVTEAFEIVKFADNMMFGNEGFPVTHCGAGITSLSIHPEDVYKRQVEIRLRELESTKGKK